jgi:diadenylate cyclase
MSSIEVLQDIVSDRQGVTSHTLEQVILLAVEIAREGREGRKVGTLFVIGDVEAVLKRSSCLILDPLYLHPDDAKRVDDPDMRETVKELAQLDGAFILSADGVFVSACRYLNVSSSNVHLPLGLGSRHMAAASITQETTAVAIVVSESSIVRVFDEGELIAEIIPWLLKHYASHMSGSYTHHSDGGMTVISKCR